MLGWAALLAAMAGAASVAQAEELPASDLFFEEKAQLRRSIWTIDPLLARYPEIVRALRAESLPEARLTADECVETMPCYRSIRHELAFAGQRLVSIFVERDGYQGGAHGSFSVSDWIWDRERRRWVRFGDLFASWPEARALLQARFCNALQERREDGYECPALEDVALGMREQSEIPVGTRARAFEIRTSDYQLGSYAAGRETVLIDIDAPLLALVRPEYRSEFEAAY